MIEAVIAGISAIVVAMLGNGVLQRRQTKDVKREVRKVGSAVQEMDSTVQEHKDTLGSHCTDEVKELEAIRHQIQLIHTEQATSNQLLAHITSNLDRRLTRLEEKAEPGTHVGY